jgi:adenylyltransferase/sulfurtransferase
VDLTNLQRQIAHRMATVGLNKAESARKAIAELNPEVQVEVVPERVEGERLAALVAAHDLVLDCSDNFATRHAVNRACVRARVPLVSGAAVRFDGQVAVFDPRRPDGACYRCLFPEEGESEDVRCAVMGVFAPLVGVVGSLQAAEALKLLAQAGEPLSNRLLLFDALAAEWRSVRLTRDPACPVCGPRS